MASAYQSKLQFILVAAFAIAAAAQSQAQVPTVLLKRGDTVDWQGQTRTVSQLFEPKFNQYGCRGISIRLAPIGQPADSDFVYWGTCGTEAPRVLRGPQTVGGVQQQKLSLDDWGFNEAGEIVYHTRLTAGGHGVWVGDTLIVRSDAPVPGMVNRFFTNPGAFGVLATTGGGPLIVSNIKTGAGNNAGIGLFQGSPPTPLLMTGDSIPGLSSPLSSQPITPVNAWRYIDVSPSGNHWAAMVELQGGDCALVVDGQAALAGGLPIETGMPVPGSVASQATWSGIGDVRVDDQGSWTALLTYRFPTAQTYDAVFRDGIPIIPVGITVGSSGPIWAIDRLHTSRSGRLAFIARDGGPSFIRLAVGRRLAISEGDEMDYNGDGLVDPGHTLDELGDFSTGTALDDDGTVWASSQIRLPTGVFEQVLLEIPGFDLGTPYCSPAIANSTGLPARISAAGHAVAGGLPLTLRATQLPVNRLGIFIASKATAIIPMAGGSQGRLCLGGNIIRFIGQVVVSGPSGTFDIDLDTANTSGQSPLVVQPGETWTFQSWYRDTNPSSTSNFTDAVQVTFD